MNPSSGSNDGHDNVLSTPQNIVTSENVNPKHAHFAANETVNEKGGSDGNAESTTAITKQPSGYDTTQLQPLIKHNLKPCPPGLEQLNAIDQIIVHQNTFRDFVGFQLNNRYDIKNNTGDDIYTALETGDGWYRHLLGSARWFDMKIMDRHENVMINMHHPLAFYQSIEVSSPPGNIIGRVEQQKGFCKPNLVFVLKNELDEPTLTIEAPSCAGCDCSFTVVFTVYNMEKEKIGEIVKHYSGFLREMFTSADDFSISFPMDLDVKMKAVCLGALFLIDMLYFENKK